jgi:hypothetical protein
MKNEYVQYINMMKELYLQSHEDLTGFTTWFETTQALCDILCGKE